MWRSTGADSNYAESKCPECTMQGKPLFECMMNVRTESGYEPAGQGAVYVAQPNDQAEAPSLSEVDPPAAS